MGWSYEMAHDQTSQCMWDQTYVLITVSSLIAGTTEGCSLLLSPVQTETPPGNEMATFLGKTL